MDPLSVMASVVGLMIAASNVSRTLSAVKLSMKDAPQLMSHVLSEVNEVEIALSALQKFLMGVPSAARRRTSLIQLDQLIATLTEAVLTFSELEVMVAPLAKKSNVPMLERLKWILEENKVATIMQRLQRHKSSLSLMLNIVQCGSDLEAEKSRETLQKLVVQLLESNQDICRRLRSIENSCDSQITPKRRLTNDGMEAIEIDNSSVIPDAIDVNDISLAGFDFQFATAEVSSAEASLEIGISPSTVDVSFKSCAARTNTWSVYSGLSLAETSMLSAKALPIYSHDISNSQWYSFGEASQSDSMRRIPTRSAASMLPAARNPLGSSTKAVKKIRNYASELRPFPRRKSAQSRRSEVSKMRLHKLVVLGDPDAGKDELLNQLCLKIFIESYDAPIEDSFRKQITIDDETCMLEVLDTAGQEEYGALRDQWIRDGDGFVLVYSTSSRSSFKRMWNFHQQVIRLKGPPALDFFSQSPPPMMLVGTRRGRVEEKEVSPREGYALANELGCGFIEADIRSGVNVEKAFFDVVRLLRKRQ